LDNAAAGGGHPVSPCVDTVDYTIEHDAEANIYRIRGRAPGFDSRMQVTSIDPAAGVVIARDMLANAVGVREVWEYRPVGDILTMRDPNGTDTSLARCGA